MIWPHPPLMLGIQLFFDPDVSREEKLEKIYETRAVLVRTMIEDTPDFKAVGNFFHEEAHLTVDNKETLEVIVYLEYR